MREEGEMINRTSGKSVFPVGKQIESCQTEMNKVSLLIAGK
ncbi:hypothetical protein VHA_000388 [Grimontia hollisae CIP 101886]|uniref:Uncharacterized protein n=1 Tax=Grimontia hollisae CIP 101886 TaxID=675812 RepID=D0I3S3_GRIHO|nr:hypothetical protein VHA_000388 [Grimontia hollisae CIP 101886]